MPPLLLGKLLLEKSRSKSPPLCCGLLAFVGGAPKSAVHPPVAGATAGVATGKAADPNVGVLNSSNEEAAGGAASNDAAGGAAGGAANNEDEAGVVAGT